jgi:hypothetical protein
MTPPALQEIPEKSWWEKNSLPIVVGEIGVVVLLLGAMFRPAVHKLAGPS